MLSLSIHQRYFIYRGQADMRKEFNGLSGLVRNHLQKDPLKEIPKRLTTHFRKPVTT